MARLWAITHSPTQSVVPHGRHNLAQGPIIHEEQTVVSQLTSLWSNASQEVALNS